MEGLPEAIALIRFTSAKYVAEFLSGKIRLGLASSYRKKDQIDLAGRFDSRELITKIDNVSNLIVEGMPLFSDFSGKAYFTATYNSEIYLLCMTAIQGEDFDLEGQLLLDARLNEFGDTAIIIKSVGEFIQRIRKSVKDGKYGWHPDAQGKLYGLVDYVDFDSFEGSVTPFQKSTAYKHQKEWRLLLMPEAEKANSHYIDIGDISHISEVIDLTSMKGGLRFKVSKAA